jgi:hypothetical protein
MALMPCAYCSLVPRVKLHVCIFAWQTQNGRQAWKTRACPRCLGPALEAFGPALPEDGDYVELPTSCTLCSEPLPPDALAVTWLTWYESDGKHSAMFATCERDALERRAALREVGEQLADREPQNGRRGR